MIARRCLLVFLWFSVFVAGSVANAQSLFVLDTAGEPVPLSEAPAPTPGHRPLLFVHGHNVQSSTDDDLNFRKNWIDSLDGLGSMAQTLRAPANATLKLTPYFLRLEDQAVSIRTDAVHVRNAVGTLLSRYDPTYDPADPNDDTAVQVVLVAYSKGTLSSRLMLKSLIEQVDGLPAPQPSLRPVSEFIAIAPPNHGLRTFASVFGTALSGDEMHNGYGPPLLGGNVCTQSGDDAARDFIEMLNGHPMADSHADAVPLGSYDSEAPGSRSPGGTAADGVLYVTLYASGNRDFVGGDVPPGAPDNTVEATSDCSLPVKQGRMLARNLAPNAINLSLASVPGDSAADVHAKTVHTGAVICHTLHTAVHGTPPTAGECTVAATDVPVITPAQRVAVELVLDQSLSMQHPACVDCAPKTAVLKSAAQLFVDLWELLAAPGDHLGVTHFRSDITQMVCAPEQDCIEAAPNSAALDQTLLPVATNAPRIRSHLGTPVPAGTTALGGALDQALTHLATFDGAAKRVVLFTDGMQNVDPRVVRVPSGCAGDACSLAIDGDPPRALDDQLGLAIDTIGVGAGDAYLSLLNDIALATGGVSRITQTPDDDLQTYFIEDVIDVLHGFSPQLVARRRGRLTEAPLPQSFVVNASAKRVIFHWRGDAPTRIVKDGVDVTALGRRISRPDYRLWTLRLPAQLEAGEVSAAGTWEVHVTGEPGTAYDISALVDEPVLDFTVSAGERHYQIGDSLALTANVTAQGNPITTPLDLTVRVWRPGTSAANLLADRTLPLVDATINLEPGTTVAEQNLARLLFSTELRAQLVSKASSLPMTTTSPGVYTTASAPVTVAGTYRVEFDVAGEHPRVGRFKRTRSVTVHVSFADADIESTRVVAARIADPKKPSRVQVDVTPRDSLGNYLGPGYATWVAATIDGQAAASPRDLGSGRYRFVIDGDAPRTTPVAVSVKGRSVFDGRLEDIEPPAPAPERQMWQYLVALLLVVMVLWLFRKITR